MTARYRHTSPKLDNGYYTFTDAVAGDPCGPPPAAVPDAFAPASPLVNPLIPLLGTTPDGSCVTFARVANSDVYRVEVEAPLFEERSARPRVLFARLLPPIRLPEPPRPRPRHLAGQRHEEMLGSIASFVPYFDRCCPAGHVPRFYDSGETPHRIFFGQLSTEITPTRLQGLVFAITGVNLTILRVADAERHTANGYCRHADDQRVIVSMLNGRVVFDNDGAWLVESGIGLEILKTYDSKAHSPHGPRRPLVAEPQPSQRSQRRDRRAPTPPTAIDGQMESS
jgi:hypothetical protein